VAKVKAKRPTRDEMVLEELGERLTEALQEETEVVLDVWGRDDAVQGKIVKLDPRTKMVHVERMGETEKVPFMDIMKVHTV
jgi:hypothetical protein